MKTPKRYQNKPIPTMPEDSEPDWYAINAWCQRAKRKNRIAQLKRSLHRYKHGTMLAGQYDLYLAYRWLQRLQKPNADADSASWENYYHKLDAIRGVLVAARKKVEDALQKALERENRKEQK